MTRGDTPTYSVKIVSKDGTPLIITTGILNPIIEFVIKEGVFYKESPIFVHRMWITSTKIFDSNEVVLYTSPSWVDPPMIGDYNKLHKKKDLINNTYTYKYFDNNTEQWRDYEFSLTFVFPYDFTKTLEPKTYLYELILLGGELKNPPLPTDSIETPINVSFKKTLLTPSEFKVEGSLSE